MRQSSNEYQNGRLINGFDYEKQAWVIDAKYARCAHPETVICDCYGRLHEDEETAPDKSPK